MLEPAAVADRLEGIEKDLAERQNDYGQAAYDRARFLRDWEKRMAISTTKAKGSNAELRKANAFLAAIETDDGDLFERLTEAEALYDSHRVVCDKVLSVRATIWQSINKMLGRG